MSAVTGIYETLPEGNLGLGRGLTGRTGLIGLTGLTGLMGLIGLIGLMGRLEQYPHFLSRS